MADRAVIDYHTNTPATPPMTAQRDPHLPPPEVCDWLLAQEWSEPATINMSSVAGDSQMYDHCQTTAELGRDQCVDLILPLEALDVLKQDREHGRAGGYTDPEVDLLQRVLADAKQTEISAFSAIGVLHTAATMMVSQCYDLTKLGDDHADT